MPGPSPLTPPPGRHCRGSLVRPNELEADERGMEAGGRGWPEDCWGGGWEGVWGFWFWGVCCCCCCCCDWGGGGVSRCCCWGPVWGVICWGGRGEGEGPWRDGDEAATGLPLCIDPGVGGHSSDAPVMIAAAVVVEGWLVLRWEWPVAVGNNIQNTQQVHTTTCTHIPVRTHVHVYLP